MDFLNEQKETIIVIKDNADGNDVHIYNGLVKNQLDDTCKKYPELLTKITPIKRMDSVVEQARMVAYKDLDTALEMVNEAFEGVNLPWIKQCVTESVMFNFHSNRMLEHNVCKWFESNYKKHLGNEWSITTVKNNPKHIPDFWVTNGVITIPVECKLNKFDSAALRQLERYMNYYGCSKGVAVACELTTRLPKNIQFVKVNLKKNERSE